MAEIQRLNALLLAQSQTNVAATMADFNAYRESTGFRTVPKAYFGAQQRPFYCFVHGSNNSHPGSACKVMAQDQRYTPAMKATTSAATGGNPNVGPPVTYRRLPVSSFANACLSCAVPDACLPFALSSAKGLVKPATPPYDENVSAGLAIRAQARTIRGANSLSRSRVDELALRESASVFSSPALLELPCLPSLLPAMLSVSVVPFVFPPLPEGKGPLLQSTALKHAQHTDTASEQPKVAWSRPLISPPTHKHRPQHTRMPHSQLPPILRAQHPAQLCPPLPLLPTTVVSLCLS